MQGWNPDDVRTVASFPTDGAAWLASARIAANSPDPHQPIDCAVVKALDSKLQPCWLVLAHDEAERDEARAILARFDR